MPVTRAHAPALRSPGLRILIGMSVCLGALFVAVDLATIAFAAQHGDKAAAGPLLGLYGLGSAIAGVWYGTRRWRAPHASRLTVALAATVLGVAPLAFMPGMWALLTLYQALRTAITAAGLGISATLASSYRVAEMAVPAGQRTEAMSWLTTAAAIGTALGAPLAGRLIDARGAPAGYLFAFAAGLAAVAIAVLRRRTLAPSPGPGPGHPDMTACHPVTHNPRAEGLPAHGQHAGRRHRRQRGRTLPGMPTQPAWRSRVPHTHRRRTHPPDNGRGDLSSGSTAHEAGPAATGRRLAHCWASQAQDQNIGGSPR